MVRGSTVWNPAASNVKYTSTEPAGNLYIGDFDGSQQRRHHVPDCHSSARVRRLFNVSSTATTIGRTPASKLRSRAARLQRLC